MNDEVFDKLMIRLTQLDEFRRKGEWADPHSSAYSSGYDRAVDKELEFLRELLSEHATTKQLEK